MNLIAFAATNSRSSINRALLEYSVGRLKILAKSDVEIEFLDLNDYEMPIYSIDRETSDGIHPLAQEFRGKIASADALLIAFAEHNGFVTAAWKNIFDWMSRIEGKVFQDKPAVILAATPGPRSGAGVLGSQELLAPFFGMDLKAKHGVGIWSQAYDGKTLTRAEDVEAVDAALMTLIT